MYVYAHVHVHVHVYADVYVYGPKAAKNWLPALRSGAEPRSGYRRLRHHRQLSPCDRPGLFFVLLGFQESPAIRNQV